MGSLSTGSDSARTSRFDSHRRLELIAGCGVVLAAAIPRLANWFANRPLSLDEAHLALNICSRSYRALLAPLEIAQTAAPGFLWLERLATQVLGPSEYALRVLPFLAGLALPALIWLLGRRLVGPRAALLAAGLSAVSFLFIYYSTEAKQYETDAAVTVLIIAAVHEVLVRPDVQRRWIVLAAVGAVALLLSQPAVFVLAGAGLALVADRGLRSQRGWLQQIAGIGVLWLVAFASVLAISYGGARHSGYLHEAWLGGFLSPLGPGFSSRVRLAAWGLVSTLVSPGGARHLALVMVVVAVALSGVVALWRRAGISTALLVAGPFIATLCTAVVGQYPIAHRLILFLGPLVCLSVASAAVWSVDHLPARVRVAAYAALWLAVLGTYGPPLTAAAAERADIGSRELARTVLASPSAEPVYVEARAAPSWLFYTVDWRAPIGAQDTARTRRLIHWMDVEGGSFTDRPTRGRAVRMEGDSLQDVARGRLELFGISTGMMNVYGIGWLTPRPDSGWAENEVRRIRAVAHPYVWIYAANFVSPQLATLMRVAVSRGARIAGSWVESDAALYRVAFPTLDSDTLLSHARSVTFAHAKARSAPTRSEHVE